MSGWSLYFRRAFPDESPVWRDPRVVRHREFLDRASAHAQLDLPFLVAPDGQVDVRVNRWFIGDEMHSLRPATRRKYAYALRGWLTFLAACGLEWDVADRPAQHAYKAWRLHDPRNPGRVSPGTYHDDLLPCISSTHGRSPSTAYRTQSSDGRRGDGTDTVAPSRRPLRPHRPVHVIAMSSGSTRTDSGVTGTWVSSVWMPPATTTPASAVEMPRATVPLPTFSTARGFDSRKVAPCSSASFLRTIRRGTTRCAASRTRRPRAASDASTGCRAGLRPPRRVPHTRLGPCRRGTGRGRGLRRHCPAAMLARTLDHGWGRTLYDGPIIDIHSHIALTPEDAMTPGHQVGAAELKAAVSLDGVIRATAIIIAGRGEHARTSARNDAVLTAADESGGFLVPVVSVHPHDGDAALTELDRVGSLGARVVKLHPNSQSFDVADDEVVAVTRRAGEHGMSVLFDAYSPFDANQTGKFVKLAIMAPKATLILAHFNGPGFSDLLAFEVAARYPWWPGNVYHDLSATAETFADSPYAEQLRWVVRKVGTDRVLYGSDWPLCDPAAALAAVRQLGFTDAEQRQILYTNAAGLLDRR